MVEQSSRECVLRPPQAIINSTITPNMTFTKTSQKFGQWADSRANTVYGLGFSCESHLAKVGNLWEPFTRVQGGHLLQGLLLLLFQFAEKFAEFKEAARLAKEKSQEKTELTSTPSQVGSSV